MAKQSTTRRTPAVHTNGKANGRANGKTNGAANGRAVAARKNGTAAPEKQESTWLVKKGLAQMLKGGVIMDVVTE